MSLDVHLYIENPTKKTSTGIFVREDGKTRELSLEEAKERYPKYEAKEYEREDNEVFHANITHNLNKMATEAGIYEYLWRPDEIGITKAKELIEPLRQGLHELKMNPDKYKAFNPENGWGSYEGLVRFVSNYLDACYEYPDATIEANR
jgi:hypothetical protein